MTDKEQIIIDGVNVSTCGQLEKYFLPNNDKEFKGCALSELYYGEFEYSCKAHPNCYFKQLARKTQECKELKEKLEAYENLALHIKCPHCNKELDLILDGTEEKISLFDRYRKALEEIEFEVTEEMKETEADTDAYGCFLEILNIINKAKEKK